ncbi:MAG: hypothetical protein FWG89_05060 [Treponema sp.]|nr:hypothetical protein [Treponema sp.]
MKKVFLLFAIYLGLCTSLTAQIPSDWDTNPPRNNAQFMFAVGISQPSATEQEALRGAWQDAVQQFAASVAVHFQGQTDITVQSESFASGIEDAHTVYMETASFSTNVPISGVVEQARRIETSGGRYVARILAAMPVADYNRARMYVANEEAAYLAYRFFGQRGLFTLAARPAGFGDFNSWLRNTCVIISVDDQNPTPLLEQLDQFTRRLYRNAVVFAQIIDGRGARIIYNSGRYYDGLLRALQNTALFTIQREGTHLTLRPVRANILNELRTAVTTMKDSGRFVITGLETIQTQGGDTTNTGAIVIGQFRTIASRQFNMQAANYTIPAQLLSGFVDEDAIIRHIENNLAAFPARYLIISRSETRLNRGIPEYNVPPIITASTHFTLYDVVTGEALQSETAQTAAGGFSPSSLEDRVVIEESRRALQFLFNARTRPGLEDIIRGVFEQL